MGIHLYDDMNVNTNTLKFIESLTAKPIWVTETGKPSVDDFGMLSIENFIVVSHIPTKSLLTCQEKDYTLHV